MVDSLHDGFKAILRSAKGTQKLLRDFTFTLAICIPFQVIKGAVTTKLRSWIQNRRS